MKWRGRWYFIKPWKKIFSNLFSTWEKCISLNYGNFCRTTHIQKIWNQQTILFTTNTLAMTLISTQPGTTLQKKNTHQKKTQSQVSISQYDRETQAKKCPATAVIKRLRKNTISRCLAKEKKAIGTTLKIGSLKSFCNNFSFTIKKISKKKYCKISMKWMSWPHFPFQTTENFKIKSFLNVLKDADQKLSSKNDFFFK